MFKIKELKNALVFLGVLLLCHFSFADKPAEWDASLISKELDGSMPVWVRVVKNNDVQKLEGSFVAAFLNNELRAVQEYQDDGLFYYPMTVKVGGDQESGYTFQFYNPNTDKVYALILPEDKDPLQYQENGYGDLSYDEETQTEIFDALVLTLPTYSITIEKGTADAAVAGEDDMVTVTAAEPTEPHTVFTHWTAEGIELTEEQQKAKTLEFAMPGNAVKLTENYGEEPKYAYTVEQGEPENGEAYEGDNVTVEAKDRSAEHKHFTHWMAEGLDLTEDELKANPLTFKMPAQTVTLTANYDDDQKYPFTVENGTPENGEEFAGETVVVTAKDRSDEHLVFNGWTSDDVAITNADQPTASFVMITKEEGVTVSANYRREDEFAVTVVGGTASKTAAFENDTITLTADTTDPDRIFVNWTSDDVAIENAALADGASFTMPKKNVAVKANFQYKIMVVNGDASKTAAMPGETVMATAEDRKEQHELFDKWDVAGLGNLTDDDLKANPLTFAMQEKAVTLTATYKPEPKVSFTVENGTPANGEDYAGTKIDITGVAPGEHLVFDHWESEPAVAFDDKNAETTKFTLQETDAVVKVKAVYVDETKVAFTVVNGTPADGEDFAGKWIEISAVAPAEHKTFVNWTSDNAEVEIKDPSAEKTEFKLPVTEATVTLTANYEDEEKYAIDVEYGTATLAEAYKNDKVKATADDLTADHLLFTGWTATGLDLSPEQLKANPLEFDMPANDVTLMANYEDEPKYAITVEKGTASPAETYAGEKVTVTANDLAADHLLFTGWTVVGVELTADELKANPLEFAMPANDVTLTANYEDEPKYTITVEKGMANVEEAYKDDLVTITADPAEEEMEFDKWIGDVEFEDATAESTSFKMLGNAVTVRRPTGRRVMTNGRRTWSSTPRRTAGTSAKARASRSAGRASAALLNMN